MSCIELNAYSLIIFIRTLRDHIPNGSDYFSHGCWDHSHVRVHLELPGV